ncbi:MAG TPA: hypothetical protein VK324_13760 [Tepidisphaeraceae bacterium]|nr:hypothetical protein [Tepidisphaeraceae bacterium]
MPCNVNRTRRRKAFDNGRRQARNKYARCPYANATLARVWAKGQRMQAAGQLAHLGAVPPSPKKPAANAAPPKRYAGNWL